MDISFDEEEFFRSTQFTSAAEVHHQQQEQQEDEELNCMPPPPLPPKKKKGSPLPPTPKVSSTTTRSKIMSKLPKNVTVTTTTAASRKRHPAGIKSSDLTATNQAISAALAAAVSEAIGEMSSTLPIPQEKLSPTKPFRGTFSYFPIDETVDLDHIVYSTSQDSGLCITIYGLGKDIGTPSLLPKINHIMGGVNLAKERIVAFRAASMNQTFCLIEKDPHVVVMTHSKYLELLDFMEKEWPRVRSKLLSDYKNMMRGEGNFRLGEEGQVYVRGEGSAVHTWVLFTTARGEELRLKTHCFSTKTSPTILISLGYSTINLGYITFTPAPLQALAKDAQVVRDALAPPKPQLQGSILLPSGSSSSSSSIRCLERMASTASQQ